MKLPIVIIGGPTASGKSKLALDLARAKGGVIINGDALQIYRDLVVLSARPDAAEEAQAPHRLYGVLDGAERGSVAEWLKLARAEIAAAHGAGALPIVVGGTGMYLRALQQGIAEVPAVSEAVREAAIALHKEIGGEAFRAELAKLDAVSAEKLFAGDTQRLIRAYAVAKGTGKTLPEWQQAAILGPEAAWQFHSYIVMPPRHALYAKCDERFGVMLQQGALDEVQRLLARKLAPDLPVMKAVGVPELAAHIKGESTLAEAKAAAQQATRNYAKRQVTWFRNQMATAQFLTPGAPLPDLTFR